FLVLERLFLRSWLEVAGKWIGLLYTFLVVLMGWVLFRAESLEMARAFYQALFAGQQGAWHFTGQFHFAFALAAVISFVPAVLKGTVSLSGFYESETFPALMSKGIACLLLLIICFSEVAVSGFHPFIYFRF